MALTISNAGASAEADGLTALLNNGYLRLYSGTRPATADTALSGNTLLAELRFGATAFGAASNGVATANAIAQDSAADATGTATFFRALQSDGTSPVLDGSVTATGGGGDMELATVSIVANVIVSVTSFTLTAPKS